MSLLDRLSPKLAASYTYADSYPLNLVYKPLYTGINSRYKDIIDERAPELLIEHEEKTFIRYIDIDGALDMRSLRSNQQVEDWLGVKPTGILPDASRPKPDPQCRLIFFLAGSGRSQIWTSKRSLTKILSYHQVTPEYLEFMAVFGLQEGPSDPMFVSFKSQTFLHTPLHSLSIPDLGRSDRLFQLCYNLKTPALKTEWSFQQTAIHYQFHVHTGRSLWIITRGNEDIYESIRGHLHIDAEAEDRDFSSPLKSFVASLSLHILLSHWALSGWKAYLKALERRVENDTGIAVYGDRAEPFERHQFNTDELRLIQKLEDEISLAIIVLAGNKRVLLALRYYYQELQDNNDFEIKDSCKADIDKFVGCLDSVIQDMDVEEGRASFFVKLISDRKGLILQYLQTQENENMASLSFNMRRIAIKSHHEAVTMSIIALVTLVFLPATFVSAFFSTDVVSYDGPGDGDFSWAALKLWMIITLPLTGLTFVVSLAIYLYRREKKHEDLEKNEYPHRLMKIDTA